jgi:hypothetical protein
MDPSPLELIFPQILCLLSIQNYQIAREVVKWSTMQQQTLGVAFSLLDTLNQNYINGAHMMILFQTIDLYRDIPDFQLHLRQVFLALGKNEDSAIHKDEFEALCDVIVLQIEQQFQSLPKSQGPFREMVNQFWWLKFSSQPFYSYFIWAATFLSLLLAICEREVIVFNFSLVADPHFFSPSCCIRFELGFLAAVKHPQSKVNDEVYFKL